MWHAGSGVELKAQLPCDMWDLRPGIEPVASALEDKVLTPGPPGKALCLPLYPVPNIFSVSLPSSPISLWPVGYFETSCAADPSWGTLGNLLLLIPSLGLLWSENVSCKMSALCQPLTCVAFCFLAQNWLMSVVNPGAHPCFSVPMGSMVYKRPSGHPG